MNEAQRAALANATQAARGLLEVEFLEQLEGTFNIRPDARTSTEGPPSLTPRERHTRLEVLGALETEHEGPESDARIRAFVREAAFTTLNRFVALKLLEARDLVQECVSRGAESRGSRSSGSWRLASRIFPTRGTGSTWSPPSMRSAPR